LLTNLTDAISAFITNLYVTTGLAGIVLAMAIESCCIPLPSEIVMPLAGLMIGNSKILSGMNPVLAIVLVALAGSIGSLIGSIAAYGIGYSGGRPLMLKYGRYLLISQHDADRADAFFQRWGSATAFFSRLLPVVRTYISLPAGITKMPFLKFCIYTFLGSFPWCVLLAYIGYKLAQLGLNLSTLSTTFHGLDIVVLLAIVALIVLYVWRHIHNDRKARAAQAAVKADESRSTMQQNQGFQMPSQGQPWNQPPATPAQQGWNQPNQPMQPIAPQPGQPPFQQQSWGQPVPPPVQQGWNQPQPPQQPQQSQQSLPPQQPFPASPQTYQPQQGWGQPQSPQPPQQPQPIQQGQGWGQPQQWQRSQTPGQQEWPSQNGNNGWNNQGR
jgi:membrane protein DedA with SNARE-associated domain